MPEIDGIEYCYNYGTMRRCLFLTACLWRYHWRGDKKVFIVVKNGIHHYIANRVTFWLPARYISIAAE